MLREIGKDLWVAEQAQKFLRIELTARMTIVALPGRVLFVNSPIRLGPELRREVDALGYVRFIVAPNRFHHLYVAEWQRAYPSADCHCAPGLETKRRELHFTGTLDDTAPLGWASEIDHIVFRAFPPLNEVVLLHHRSRTATLPTSCSTSRSTILRRRACC
jgi:Domain of unknown function (DUF4336)